ncbi:AraC family transcriptional regulator [Vibrio comitans]|uniref:AraC family transcriptional regulator n=1 Tax=Vibrio comitans NBRC 102076 TaxID=1219078 RepID=A0A4Y3IIL7_9VIBR|nr:AraC family transcriptional regulator [Vibrio comitans]GEA58842.1 AraC family transcriptional regulator [Vibrio comitans NBRC 102076]
MANSFSIAFGRTGLFWLYLKAMDDYYGGCVDKVKLPTSLIDDPMRLMPLTEMTRYFGVIDEIANDELFVAKGCSKIKFENFPPLNNIVCSSPVFFTAMLRLTALTKSVQSGCTVRGVIDAGFLKWSYNTEISVPSERLNDGIVAAWIFILLLRKYKGEQYQPEKVCLPGSRLGKPGEMEEIFGCKAVQWNAKQTEIHCLPEVMGTFTEQPQSIYGAKKLKYVEVLDYINLPDENDLSRCVYELIDYSRAFGYPRLEFIADILMVAPLTLQRRLQKDNLSFSELVKYKLLLDLAPQMLSEGQSIADVAAELGFSNTQSFIKAFKKAHDFTPRQYVESLEEYTQ